MAQLENAKHELFACTYAANGLNATEAAIAAGYAPGSAASQGSKLLSRPDIERRVRELVRRSIERAEVTADRTILELARVGYADIRQLFDLQGNLLNVHQLSQDAAASIEGIDVQVVTVTTKDPATGQDVQTTTRTVKVRRGGKLQALRMLAQYQKLLTPDPEDVFNAIVGYGDQLAKARDRIQRHREQLPPPDSPPPAPRA